MLVPRPKAPKNKIVNLESLARVHTETAIKTIAGIMNQPASGAAVRLTAANILLDRGYGKPQAAVEVTGKDGGAIELSALSPHEMARRYDFTIEKVKETLKQIESKVIEHGEEDKDES